MKNILLLFISSTLINSFTSIAQNYGVWREIDSMNVPRVGHAIVELPNENILVSGNGVDSVQSSCEIYDITTGKWRYTTRMNIPRNEHSMIKLNNGKVLAVGGYREKSCELYDYQNEVWTITDSLIYERWYGQTVLKLADGRVMIIGGVYYDTTIIPWHRIILDKVEIYDDSTNQWEQVSSLHIGRSGHTATLLNDGKVLVTGGQIDSGSTNSCEIYDPVSKSWTMVSPMNENREEHAALLLDDNRVLVSGSGGLLQFVKKSCELYLIRENSWIPTGDMFNYRSGHFMTKYPSTNKIIIVGGDILNTFTCNDSYEIYNVDSLISESLFPFPTSQMLGAGFLSSVTNIFQNKNKEIYVIGNVEVICDPMPFAYPTKRCWIFDTTTEVDEAIINVKDFQLFQNYPNPFNPVTTIGYNLKEQSKVELKIFDILGNEVITLVDDILQAGYHQAEFNTNNLEEGLSSGIYIYQIKARGLGESKTYWQKSNKMILLK
ncbi:MAG: T9SS type A sorting domain-containing protein [Ignavibacterium sp.]|nr:T9SS type A sorting domain-containing protein [Ignavibacterium sp.]